MVRRISYAWAFLFRDPRITSVAWSFTVPPVVLLIDPSDVSFFIQHFALSVYFSIALQQVDVRIEVTADAGHSQPQSMLRSIPEEYCGSVFGRIEIL